MSTPLQTLPFYLASPVGATDTSINVKGLKDSRGNAITAMPYGATIIFVTLEPQSPSNQEIISFTGITNVGSGIVTLTGVVRNYSPVPPLTVLSANVPHSNGATCVISNNPQFYATYMKADEDVTVTAIHKYPTPTDPSSPITKSYFESVVIAGGVDASPTAKGVAKLSVTPNNNLGSVGYLLSLGTATVTIANPAVVSRTAHGLVLNDIVQFTTTGTLPTGITASTNYYVISTGLTADAFQLSTTLGGSAIITTGSQSGTHTLFKLATISIGSPAIGYLTSHGFTAGDTIYFTTTGSLPIGVLASTTYYVLSAGLTANSFEFSLLPNGTPVVTSGTQSGTHTLFKTTPTAVSTDDPRMITVQQAGGINNAYPSAMTPTNPPVGKDIIYTDGISISQLTDDSDVAFGQDNATSKRSKLAQSFIPTKSTITSILLKKGTSVATPVVTTDTTCSTFTFTTGGSTGGYIDNGIVSSKRDISINATNHVNDYWELSKTMPTGSIGDTHAGSFKMDTSNSPSNATNWEVYADGVLVGSGSVTNFTTNNNLAYSFTATTTAPVIKLRKYNTVNMGSTQVNADVYNFTNTSTPVSTYNVTLDIYADNNGVPSTTSLGTATVTSAVYNAVSANTTFLATFGTVISNLNTASTYWLVMQSSSPSATVYPTIRKINAGAYSGGVMKYNNSPDGWVADAGDFYFQINQTVTGVIPVTDTQGTLNSFVTVNNFTAQAMEALTAFNAVCAQPIQADGGIKVYTSGGSGNGSTGQTIAIGNNPNRMLVVFAEPNDGSTGVTATFNGTSMSSITNTAFVAFYTVAPAIGTGTLVLSKSCAYAYHSIYNVAQTAPETNKTSTNVTSESLATLSDGASILFGFGTASDNYTTWNATGEGAYGGGVIGGGNLGVVASYWSGQVFPIRTVPITLNTGGFGDLFIALSFAPATAPTYTGVAKTYSGNTPATAPSQYANKWSSFLGFVTSAFISGAMAKVQVNGIVTGFTGLTPFTTYYLSDTSGAISTTTGTNSKKVGYAISSTTLLIKHDN